MHPQPSRATPTLEGLHRHVSYPIDETTEELAFQYFVRRAADVGSSSHRLLRWIEEAKISEAWTSSRGRPGSLAERMMPCATPLHVGERAVLMDSARLLGVLFDDPPSEEVAVAIARFVKELLDETAWWPNAGSLRQLAQQLSRSSQDLAA